MSEQHRVDTTLECREATGSPGRLVGLILPVGRVASDRPELFIGSGVSTPREGYGCYRNIGHQLSSCSLIQSLPATDRYEWIIFCRTRQKCVALAASVRSGKTPGLSVEFHSLDEARVSGVREVRHSLVTAVATVPSQAYDQARAEVRSKRRRVWL